VFISELAPSTSRQLHCWYFFRDPVFLSVKTSTLATFALMLHYKQQFHYFPPLFMTPSVRQIWHHLHSGFFFSFLFFSFFLSFPDDQ
jgi:hypothetical protein